MSISGKDTAHQRAKAKNEGVRTVPLGEALTSGTWITRGPGQTVELGKALGKCLSGGDVVALYGELGSGKTTFVKGMASGLGAEHAEGVKSPTFVLLNLYKGRIPVYHIDLYRVQSLETVHDIGYREYAFGEGVTVIEWAEKAEHLLPEGAVRVWLKSLGKRSREVRVQVPNKKCGKRS
jgi:tRNA threonylcarbamoyladenosine biosynthesis protein TsaE